MDHGKMKCRIVCLLLLFAAALAGCAAGAEERECGGCRVWLPDSYEAEQAYHYPVLYLLPEDGYRAEEDSLFDCLTGKIGEGQGMEMIIVRPAFTKEDDIPSRMRET